MSGLGGDLPESWQRGGAERDADRNELAIPPCDPIATARSFLAEFPIRAPEDIAIELMAAARDAFVIPRANGTADARVVCDGSVAFIGVAPEAIGTARGRFSVAHELAHWLMHRAVLDAIERIHGRPRTRGREFRVEREADVCASELLMPTSLFAPHCRHEMPTLDHVSEVGATFRTSLTATARKWAAVSGTGCAWVESRGGIVRDCVRSAGFRGTAVRTRKLEAGTVAAELAAGGEAEAGKRVARVHRTAWGAGRKTGEVLEESIRVAGSSLVLTWLVHAG